jgi:hypothetical protein
MAMHTPRQFLVGFSGLDRGHRDRAVLSESETTRLRWDYELSAHGAGGRTMHASFAEHQRPQMPLFRYFVVVGLVLIGLLYVISATLSENTPPLISNNIDGVTSNNGEINPPAPQHHIAAAAPEPDMTSSTVALAAAAPAETQKLNTPSTLVVPPRNKRKRYANKRVWRSGFRRAHARYVQGWHDPFWNWR